MRGDTTLDDRPVVALWMSKVKEIVEVDQQFSVMVRKMNIGKGCKRDLLEPGSDDTVIKRGKNSCRRSCIALYLNDERWPREIIQDIHKGKLLYPPPLKLSR